MFEYWWLWGLIAIIIWKISNSSFQDKLDKQVKNYYLNADKHAKEKMDYCIKDTRKNFEKQIQNISEEQRNNRKVKELMYFYLFLYSCRMAELNNLLDNRNEQLKKQMVILSSILGDYFTKEEFKEIKIEDLMNKPKYKEIKDMIYSNSFPDIKVVLPDFAKNI